MPRLGRVRMTASRLLLQSQESVAYDQGPIQIHTLLDVQRKTAIHEPPVLESMSWIPLVTLTGL